MDKDQVARHEVSHDGFAQPKKTMGSRLRRSCARFWWLYLLAFAIIVVVIVVPIIYVGYPKLAQKTVNEADLTINAYRIENPAPDTFDLVIDSIQHSDSKNHANLDAFNASLYLPNSEISFVSFEAPAIKSGAAAEVNIQQRVTLDNPDEFVKYCLTTFGSKTYSYSLRGKGGLKLGGLPKTTVTYDQEVHLAGLDGLQGLTISAYHLLKDPGAFNSNSNGAIVIPNPSVVTIDAGNVTATMSVGDVPVANITLPDVSLAPGNVSYPFFATTNQTAVAGLLKQPEYSCGLLPLSIQVDASTFDGQLIPYLTTALRSAALKVDLDVAPTLKEAGFGFLLGDSCSK